MLLIFCASVVLIKSLHEHHRYASEKLRGDEFAISNTTTVADIVHSMGTHQASIKY